MIKNNLNNKESIRIIGMSYTIPNIKKNTDKSIIVLDPQEDKILLNKSKN